MKPSVVNLTHDVGHVAPRVGAWIETALVDGQDHPTRSPPAWGRGLKLCGACHFVLCWVVAPRVGAWIET